MTIYLSGMAKGRSYRPVSRAAKKAGDRLRRQLDSGYAATRARGAGAPPKYRPGFCELATKFCLLGLTNEELGAQFGVTKETIQEWQRTKPEFKAALLKGREGADAEVAAALFKRAKGMTLPDDVVHFDTDSKKFRTHKRLRHLAPDPGSAKFILANRAGIRGRDSAKVGNTWAANPEAPIGATGPIDLTVNFVEATKK